MVADTRRNVRFTRTAGGEVVADLVPDPEVVRIVNSLVARCTPRIDASPIQTGHCGHRWVNEGDEDQIRWICLLAPEHEGAHSPTEPEAPAVRKPARKRPARSRKPRSVNSFLVDPKILTPAGSDDAAPVVAP